jgi:hypothetical protein
MAVNQFELINMQVRGGGDDCRLTLQGQFASKHEKGCGFSTRANQCQAGGFSKTEGLDQIHVQS